MTFQTNLPTFKEFINEKVDMCCPKCGSHNVSTQRRPDGDSTCQYCGYKSKTEEFIKAAE